MSELNLYYKIKDAFETSTANTNRFAQMLNRIKWDNQFKADDEYYFVKGGFTFTTPSLNPFNMPWEASGLFSDGSYLTF